VANLRLKPGRPRWSDMDFIEAIEICREAVYRHARDDKADGGGAMGGGGSGASVVGDEGSKEDTDQSGSRETIDYRLLTEDLVEGCWMARHPDTRTEGASVLSTFIRHDVLLSSYAIPPPEHLVNAPGALPGGIPRAATLQQLLRYCEALQPLDDPAAKADAVNAIALPEIELRRRARSASEALLARLAGLSATPAWGGGGSGLELGLSLSHDSGGGGGGGGPAAQGLMVTAAPSAAAPAGSSGGPAARLADTCAALRDWLTPLAHRLASLRTSLRAAVGTPMPVAVVGLDQGTAAENATVRQRLMLTALLRPVWASEAAAATEAVETALAEVRNITRAGFAAAAAAANGARIGGSGSAASSSTGGHLGIVAAALLAGRSPTGWAPAPALEGRPLALWQRGLEASHSKSQKP
jgi:hypothetical protein